MPLDIMLPFYGDFGQFKEAVSSVLAQTDPNWRLVIIDDQYPDPRPGEWAQALDDERITYQRNEVNLRISGNFNESIRLIANDHAVILGCDDILLPEYVSRVSALIAEYPQAALIQPGVEVIDSSGTVVLPLADRIKAWCRPRGTGTRLLSGERLATSLLRGNWLYFPSLVWRADVFESRRFRSDLDVVQDLDMIMSIVEAGESLLVDEKIVFQYRRHEESLSAKRGPDGKKFIEERLVFRETAERARLLGWSRTRRAARLRITSRANSLSEVPVAIKLRSGAAVKSLLRHTFGR
ncbi:glycosyltransferase [Mycetocola spongiae]|uniref:glycosyltransferase n=1 Tax=Mycetocola spongiae TaxID=2859226 RepID=UPI001CF19417|nr:glycosyltransferase [Mycetocola spongiae]UCR90334.1 glycosyltransferase [Mycetocola spongiae]